jgi:hypothetical protein
MTHRIERFAGLTQLAPEEFAARTSKLQVYLTGNLASTLDPA